MTRIKKIIFLVLMFFIIQQGKASIDSLWNNLIFKEGGCLTGGQYIYDGEIIAEGSIIHHSKGWKHFFDFPKSELTTFLLSKLTDTLSTKIHTCPFFNATEGELAVYCLQKLFLVNWYDFDEFRDYRNRDIDDSENHQVWLQKILLDDKSRETLKECWYKVFKNK